MACCLLPFSGDPVEGQVRQPNDWQVLMKDSCFKDPCICCFGFWCAECAAYKLRRRALKSTNSWPQGYLCCQGVTGNCLCFKPGHMGEESCPKFCLCLESCCCTGMGTSGTYIYVMQAYKLNNDPCYNKFVRFSNFCQLLACFCSILACFCEELQECAQCIRLIADFVFRTLMGCINAQVNYELNYQEKSGGKPQPGYSGHGHHGPSSHAPYGPPSQPGYVHPPPQGGYQPPPTGYPAPPPHGYPPPPPQGYPPPGYGGYSQQGYPQQGYAKPSAPPPVGV